MIDYMATPEETRKHPEALSFFQSISAGDQNVFQFLWAMWNFAHVWDDFMDGSDWPHERKEQAQKALHDWMMSLILNPWVKDHALELRSLMVSALSRHLDGDIVRDPVMSAAVRCGDLDLYMYVAYLTGGWESLRKWSPNREFDKPEVK